MIKIGILGDIGSGKSYVAQSFGYPVFDADYEVAKLYQKNKDVFKKLPMEFAIEAQKLMEISLEGCSVG